MKIQAIRKFLGGEVLSEQEEAFIREVLSRHLQVLETKERTARKATARGRKDDVSSFMGMANAIVESRKKSREQGV